MPFPPLFHASQHPSDVSVDSTLREGAKRLREAGVASPEVEAEWLLARVLSLGRLQLSLERERRLTSSEAVSYEKMVRRRCAREPLQYILNDAPFCGLTLVADRRALIPRPETEQLATMAWEAAGSIAVVRPWVLDFGTGTGAIALSVAHHCDAARVLGIDRSARALELARENRSRLDLNSRVTFLESDGFSHLASDRRFDLMVSNPPYIPRTEVSTLAPEIRDWEPAMALDGGDDGLDFYRRIASRGRARLRHGGRFFAEFGDGQTGSLLQLFSSSGWKDLRVERDLSGSERFLIATA